MEVTIFRIAAPLWHKEEKQEVCLCHLIYTID